LETVSPIITGANRTVLMPHPPHTALVEFSTSHLICLQSQIRFLTEAGATVELILATQARERAMFLTGAHRTHYLDVQYGLKGRWRTVIALRRALGELGVDAVVFNTAEGNHVRDFSLIAPGGLLYAGFLHHTNKMRRSFTQRLISRRLRRYFVLMDYLLDGLPDSTGCRFAAVSPIFHASDNPPEETAKPPGEFWICIPGEVEFRRRDYQGLAEAVRKTVPDPRIRFILLGSAQTQDSAAFEGLLGRSDRRSQFVVFPDYVSQEVFAGYLARCDLILPLTHPGIGLYTDYRHHQVSGSFLEALAYSVPMLLDRSWTGVREFEEISLFYDREELIPTLNDLAQDGRPLTRLRERYARSRVFSFAEQQRRFLEMLEPTTDPRPTRRN
jgi:hypothetical protein